MSLSYETIESDSDLSTGGGPLRAQWSARWSRDRLLAPATDFLVSLPNGDATLHPLSAKAPSVEARLRIRLFEGVWIGAHARRVSPPKDRVDPEAYFPSGGGVDFSLRREMGRLGLGVDLRRPTGGLPRATFGLARIGWRLEEGLAVELAGMLGLGPSDARLIESGWQLGIRYSRERAPAPRRQPSTP